MKLYLHADLDLDAAIAFWASVTGIPAAQFSKPYRAVADATLRTNRHVFGCPGIVYSSTPTHRSVMGMIEAILSSPRPSGVAQLAEHATVNRVVVGSSPTPGATTMGPFAAAGVPSHVFGAVAQWSEQGTHNPWVVGSIPTRPTSSETIFSRLS